MPFKVQVGPHQVSIHHGQTVLVSEADGQINWPSEKGLYFFDTRVISSWTIYANGEPWELLNGGAITPYASRIYLTNSSDPDRGRHHSAPHTWSRYQPADQRGNARGPRPDQQQHEARGLSARDRVALRLRRHLRSKVEQHRSSRTYCDNVVADKAAVADQLSQWRFRSRGDGGSDAPSAQSNLLRANAPFVFCLDLPPPPPSPILSKARERGRRYHTLVDNLILYQAFHYHFIQLFQGM